MPLRGRACGGAASIEGAVAPYGRKVRQPLKGCAPCEDWLRQCFYPLTVPHKKRTSHMRGSYTLPEFVPKAKGSRFGAMLLDEERGRHGPPAIEGADAPYEDWLRQCFYPLTVPHKKRTSHKRFVSTFGVRSTKPQLPRFGAMILDEERVFGESRRWERTLVRDQWRLSPKRSYSPKAFAK